MQTSLTLTDREVTATIVGAVDESIDLVYFDLQLPDGSYGPLHDEFETKDFSAFPDLYTITDNGVEIQLRAEDYVKYSRYIAGGYVLRLYVEYVASDVGAVYEEDISFIIPTSYWSAVLFNSTDIMLVNAMYHPEIFKNLRFKLLLNGEGDPGVVAAYDDDVNGAAYFSTMYDAAVVLNTGIRLSSEQLMTVSDFNVNDELILWIKWETDLGQIKEEVVALDFTALEYETPSFDIKVSDDLQSLILRSNETKYIWSVGVYDIHITSQHPNSVSNVDITLTPDELLQRLDSNFEIIIPSVNLGLSTIPDGIYTVSINSSVGVSERKELVYPNIMRVIDNAALTLPIDHTGVDEVVDMMEVYAKVVAMVTAAAYNDDGATLDILNNLNTITNA